jgi:hypothetical protein
MTTMRDSLRGMKYFSARRVANNTFRVKFESGKVAIRLHNTNIIEVTQNQIGEDVYFYYMGGWDTTTTRDRLNRFGPLNIYRRRGETYAEDSSGTVSEFFEGLTVIGGRIENPIIPEPKKTRTAYQVSPILQAEFIFAERGRD